MSEPLLQAFDYQINGCKALGAPFSARLLERAREDIEAGGETAELLESRSKSSVDELIRDALPLRLLASLHYLVLDDRAPDLAKAYPPQGDDPDEAWTLARPQLRSERDLIKTMLEHEPQTNEVRRSACLLGGFLTIGEETSLPLRCFELGASAGLNSMWKNFRYEIDGQTWGDPESPVHLTCQWKGPAPDLATDLQVAERRACDRRPVNLQEPEEATRLLSYCWAEQEERMARLRAAVSLAQSSDFKVEALPARAFVAEATPRAGTATVVFHSIMWQYMSKEEQGAVRSTLEDHFANATEESPFYWLRMETDDTAKQIELRLRTWNQPEDRLLAIVHPHGASARWI